MKRDFLVRWITREGEVIKQGMAHHVESTNDLIDVITFDLLPEIDFDFYEIEANSLQEAESLALCSTDKVNTFETVSTVDYNKEAE